jgi:hypothetical protein
VSTSRPVASPAERPASGIERAAQLKAPCMSLGALSCAALSMPSALRAARRVRRSSPLSSFLRVESVAFPLSCGACALRREGGTILGAGVPRVRMLFQIASAIGIIVGLMTVVGGLLYAFTWAVLFLVRFVPVIGKRHRHPHWDQLTKTSARGGSGVKLNRASEHPAGEDQASRGLSRSLPTR